MTGDSCSASKIILRTAFKCSCTKPYKVSVIKRKRFCSYTFFPLSISFYLSVVPTIARSGVSASRRSEVINFCNNYGNIIAVFCAFLYRATSLAECTNRRGHCVRVFFGLVCRFPPPLFCLVVSIFATILYIYTFPSLSFSFMCRRSFLPWIIFSPSFVRTNVWQQRWTRVMFDFYANHVTRVRAANYLQRGACRSCTRCILFPPGNRRNIPAILEGERDEFTGVFGNAKNKMIRVKLLLHQTRWSWD